MSSLVHRILFVHGYPLDHRLWDGQKTLTDEVRILTLPGFGGRAPFEDSSEDVSLAHYAEAVHDEIRAWGDTPVVLAALSMGGYIAFECWRRFPEKISALILCDTRAEADSAEGKAARSAAIEKVRQGGSGAMFEKMATDLVAPSRREDGEFHQRVLRMMRDADPIGVEQALFAMRNRDDYRADLGGITVPTLVVVGEHDALTPPAGARSMADAIPRAQMVVIPDAGHLAPMERPDEVNEAITAFFGE